MSNQRLGKGLDELLPEQDDTQSPSLTQLPVNEIAPNPEQPRQSFDEAKLDELTASIEEQGVVEPIVVRPYPDGDRRYMIVAGERRWRASRQAGLERIPGIVRDLKPRKAYLLSLIENVQRENLSPLEEARAYRQLIDNDDMNQESVADSVGKSRSAVANRLRLLNLPDDALDALDEGVISAGHARALLALTPDRANTALNRIIEKDLSVRETEELVKQVNEQPDDSSPEESSAENVRDRPKRFDRLEAELESSLGTAVEIKSNDRKSGNIILYFDSPEEFESLRDRLQ